MSSQATTGWEIESTQDLSPSASSVKIPAVAPGQPDRLQAAYRNNNPGNLEYAGQPGATQNGRWAKFDDPDSGYDAVKAQIVKDAGRGLTLEQYISKYAPASDGNDTERYIQDAAKSLGVDRTAKLGTLDYQKLAAFQVARESDAQVAQPSTGWEVESESPVKWQPENASVPPPAAPVAGLESLGGTPPPAGLRPAPPPELRTASGAPSGAAPAPAPTAQPLQPPAAAPPGPQASGIPGMESLGGVPPAAGAPPPAPGQLATPTHKPGFQFATQESQINDPAVAAKAAQVWREGLGVFIPQPGTPEELGLKAALDSDLAPALGPHAGSVTLGIARAAAGLASPQSVATMIVGSGLGDVIPLVADSPQVAAALKNFPGVSQAIAIASRAAAPLTFGTVSGAHAIQNWQDYQKAKAAGQTDQAQDALIEGGTNLVFTALGLAGGAQAVRSGLAASPPREASVGQTATPEVGELLKSAGVEAPPTEAQQQTAAQVAEVLRQRGQNLAAQSWQNIADWNKFRAIQPIKIGETGYVLERTSTPGKEDIYTLKDSQGNVVSSGAPEVVRDQIQRMTAAPTGQQVSPGAAATGQWEVQSEQPIAPSGEPSKAQPQQAKPAVSPAEPPSSLPNEPPGAAASPVPQQEPQAPVPGASFEINGSKYQITRVEPNKIVYDQTLPDGTVQKGKSRPLLVFQNMMASAATPQEESQNVHPQNQAGLGQPAEAGGGASGQSAGGVRGQTQRPGLVPGLPNQGPGEPPALQPERNNGSVGAENVPVAQTQPGTPPAVASPAPLLPFGQKPTAAQAPVGEQNAPTPQAKAPETEDIVTGTVDKPLTEEGRKDIEKIAPNVSNADSITAGPMARTEETAEIQAEANKKGAEPTVDPAFGPWDLAGLQGQRQSAVKDQIDHYIQHPDEPVPGGESFGDYTNRFIGGLQQKIADWKPGQQDVIDTHSIGVHTALAWAAAGSPADRSIDLQAMLARQHMEPGTLYRYYPPTGQMTLVTGKPGDGIILSRHGDTEWDNLEPQPHDYSSTQVQLPENFAKFARLAADRIKDKDLGPDGRETDPHITLKYGLHDQNSTAVEKALQNEGPITAKIGKVSIFPASEATAQRGGAQYDVVKLDVDSPDLQRLNAKVAELPHTDTHPVYQPHITLAYVKPGEGAKYVGKSVPGLTGKTVTFNSVRFSSKSGTTTDIPLAGKAQPQNTRVAPSEPIPASHWMNRWEVEEAADKFKNDPVIGPLAKFLHGFMEEVDDHSDGWPYWKAPAHAARQLEQLIQFPDYASESNIRKAFAPIKTFYTTKGYAAGMKWPEIAGIERPQPKLPASKMPSPIAAQTPVGQQEPQKPTEGSVEQPPEKPPSTPGKMITLTGDTYKNRFSIRNLEGAKWQKNAKNWRVADTEKNRAIIAKMSGVTIQGEAATPPQGAETPVQPEAHEPAKQASDVWKQGDLVTYHGKPYEIGFVGGGIVKLQDRETHERMHNFVPFNSPDLKRDEEPKSTRPQPGDRVQVNAHTGMGARPEDFGVVDNISTDGKKALIKFDNGDERAVPIADVSKSTRPIPQRSLSELEKDILRGLSEDPEYQRTISSGAYGTVMENAGRRDAARQLEAMGLIRKTSASGYYVRTPAGTHELEARGEATTEHAGETPVRQQEPQTTGTAETVVAPEQVGARALAKAVYLRLRGGLSLGNVTEFNKLAEEAFGSSRTSGNWTPKDAFDAMEAGINRFLIERGQDLMSRSADDGLHQLRELMGRITSQGVRTEEQDKFQQFSTPPTESYVVAKVANLKPTDVVLEPSAGNGGLAVWPKAIGAKVYVNEISERRREMLDAAGFGEASAHDGEIINSLLDENIRPTVILMNPPFSAGGAKKGPAKNSNQYGFNHVNSALQRLAPGGRLVAILGGGRADDANGGATLLGGPSGAWFTDIAKRYNVRANVRINGKEYQKYGTNFATRIIVIDKDGPTPSRVKADPDWSSVLRGNANTLEEAYNLLRNVAESRPEPGTEAAAPAPRGPRGARKTQPGTAQAGTAGQPGGGHGELQPSGAGTPGERGTSGPAEPGKPVRATGGRRPGAAGERPGAVEPANQPAERPQGAAPGSPQSSLENAPAGTGKLTRQQILDAAKKKFAESRPSQGAEPGAKPTVSLPAPTLPSGRKPTAAATSVPQQSQQTPTLSPAQKAAAEAKQRMRDRMAQAAANQADDEPIRTALVPQEPRDMDSEDLIDLSAMGAGHIVDGATNYQDWSDALMNDAGEMVSFAASKAALPVSDALRQIYELASSIAADYGVTAEPAPPLVAPEEADTVLDGNGDMLPLDLERNLIPESEKDDSVAYVEYHPSIKGPQHPGSIVESKTMSTVPLPEITYHPQLPKAVIDKGNISAVQLEAIALAGQQNNTILPDGSRSMLLIGDGTGVGKGREAAGILWDNFRQGRKRLMWISQNWDLMQDAMRDLEGVGAKEMTRGNEKNARGQYTTSGKSFVRPLSDFGYGQPIKHQGLLFSTYGTARAKDKKGNKKITQIEEYLRGDDDGEGAYLVIDESHNLKNAVVGGRAKPSQQGEAIRSLLQKLPKLRVVALSATAATDVINLGWMDRLGIWGPGTAFPTGFNEFAGAIASGKTAAMEMIASELKAQGKYLSRTLSYKGVEFSEEKHELTEDQKAIYRTAAKAWKHVFEAGNKTIATTTNGGSEQRARFNQSLGGSQQRFFNILITALKTPTAIELANKALADGKSVIITMVNTGEAAQNREKNRVAAARENEDEQDDIPEYDFGPKQILIDQIRENYPVQQFADDVDDNGNPIKVPVTRIDEEGREVPVLNPEAVAARDALIAEIDRDLHMPENPLDILINALGGPKEVAELTGRKERFDSSSGKFVPRGDPNVARKNINISEMKAFQDGKKRVAVLTGAANAGISLHSSNEVPNKQQRYHITLQVGWEADKAMQMLGRSHRTNQAHPPQYVLLYSDLAGEKRFISTISRRLGSLGALTKGQKNATTGTDLMDKVNLETAEGRAAATAFYEALMRNIPVPGTGLTGMQVLTDMRILKGQPPTVPQADRPNVTKMMNRLLALDPDIQNAAYNYFYDIFQATIEKAIEQGTLDTGVKTIPGDEFQVKEQRSIAKDPKTGAETYYYPVDAQIRTNRVSPAQLVKRMEDHADDEPVIVRDSKGNLTLAINAPPVVHASGAVEPAVYISSPGRGRWLKAPQARIRGYNMQPVEEWAKEQLTDAETEVENAERTLKYAKQDLERGYGQTEYYKTRAENAETTLSDAKEKLEDAKEIAADPMKWAKEEWGRQYEDEPSHQTEEYHLVGRAVMKYWNAIRDASGFTDILTTVDSKTGKRVVGVSIPADAITKLLQRISGGGSTVNARQLVVDVLKNNVNYTLEGGIRVRRGTIARQAVIQLIPPNQEVARNLQNLGVLYERGVSPVYYLPNTYEEGLKGRSIESLVNDILKQYPIQADEEPIRQSRGVPGFYSQLERVIEQKMPQRAPAAQVLATIRNPQSGVKPDELKWSGLDDWLQEKKGQPVTRAEVQEFLRANGVRLQEVEHGSGAEIERRKEEIIARTNAIDDQLSKLSEDANLAAKEPRLETEYTRIVDQMNALHDERRELDQEFNGLMPIRPRYGEYTLPGGENYRELLLTLPGKAEQAAARLQDIDRRMNEITYAPHEYYEHHSAELETLKEERQKLQNLALAGPVYRSTHWPGIVNPVAHIRFDDRTGPNGERILHVAEIQSDWHQEGRKKGYLEDLPKDTELEPVEQSTTGEVKRFVRFYMPRITAPGRGIFVARVEPGESLYTAANRRWQQYLKQEGKQSVPPAPFSKTWPELAFRRILRYAAENGYDKLTWDTGATNADRYDLSKRVSGIAYQKSSGEIYIKPLGEDDFEGTPIAKNVPPDKLADYIGKEAAERLMAQPAYVSDEGGKYRDEEDGYHEIHGADLKVGGEGMAGFYDKILPDYASRYLKKWGGKVENSNVPTVKSRSFLHIEYANGVDDDEGYNVVEEGETEPTAHFHSEHEALSFVDKAVGAPRTVAAHSVNITPQMRESVMEGQPLFAKDVQPAGKPTPTPTVYRNGIVWVGGQTMDALTNKLGLSRAAGMYVPPAKALGLTNIVTGPLREAIADALREGRKLIFVRHDPGQPLSKAIALARHELFHAAEEWMGNDERGKQLMQNPLAQKAMKSLNYMGYPSIPALVFSEIGAHLAEGPAGWDKLNLTRAEAKELFESYLGLLSPEVVSRIDRIAPQLKEGLYAERALRQSARVGLDTGSSGEVQNSPPREPGREARRGLGEDVPSREVRLSREPAENPFERAGRLDKSIALATVLDSIGASPKDVPRLTDEQWNAIAQTGNVHPPNSQETKAEVAKQLARIQRIRTHAGERGAAPALSDFSQWLTNRFGSDAPKANYSGLTGLQKTFLPGQQTAAVEAASKPVAEKAHTAAASRAQAHVLLHNAVPAIEKVLKPAGYSFAELRLLYTESRLRGIRNRYEDFALQAEASSDEDLEKGFSQEFAHLLSTIEGKGGLPQDLGQTAAALLEAKDFDTLRTFLQDTFRDAVARVARVMTPADFDYMLDGIKNDPALKEGHRLYKDLIESEIARNHALNEGVFSTALGPAETYVPLIPTQRIDQKFGPGRRLPYRKPANSANLFATGLSEAYAQDMEAFANRVAGAFRANDKAALLKTMQDTGWLIPEPQGWDGTFTGPDGEVYQGVREETSPSRVIVQGRKITHTPAHFSIMPKFMNDGLRLVLAREPADSEDISNKAARFLNLLATRGPFELMFHSAGLRGALIANTPFLGKSGLDVALSLPIVKSMAVLGKGLLAIDPKSPENVAKLQRLARVGALPARSGSVTYSKEYAEATGAKREFGFGPMLFGPKGVDARARILAYDIATAWNPNISDLDLYHFVNQLGNYTPELQGGIERWLKKVGVGPFATASMTRIVNGIHSWTLTGPKPSNAFSVWLGYLLTGSAIVSIGLWAILHKEATGKWPTQDKLAKLGYIPMVGRLAQYRHTWLGNHLWGTDKNTVGYLHIGWWNPLPERAARFTGLRGAFETAAKGGNPWQMKESALTDFLNSIAQPASGPATRAIFVGAFGREPYLTGVRDTGGEIGPQLMPAVPKQLKPGFLGGLAPALVKGQPVKKAGFAAQEGAKTAAAIRELNSFWGDIGEDTGILGPDRGDQAAQWLRMLFEINPLTTGLVGNATNPYAKSEYLRKQRQAVGNR